jgi:NADPH2:quinone reductase
MKAMVLPKFGDAGVFEVRDIERPEPGKGEVLIKIIASATNPVDAKIRATGSWAGLKLPAVLGYDAAGIIEKTGKGVENFKVGDEVYYTPFIHGNVLGTYAEYNVVNESIIAKKPESISFEEAAAIPLAGGTAWEALIRKIKIRTGETILIQGAAGGVGSYAVQFAKLSGARVIATASPGNHEFLYKLGADKVVDYKDNDQVIATVLDETNGKGTDAVFDIEGDDVISRCLPAAAPFGRMSCLLPPKGNLGAINFKNITLYGVFLVREAKRLEEMAPLFSRGLVHSVIEKTLSLEEVSEAHKRLDSKHGRGKIVLRIGD